MGALSQWVTTYSSRGGFRRRGAHSRIAYVTLPMPFTSIKRS
jgi:hypothetical protein